MILKYITYNETSKQQKKITFSADAGSIQIETKVFELVQIIKGFH